MAICVNCWNANANTTCSACGSAVHKDCAPKGKCDTCALSNTESTPSITLPDVIRRSHIEQYKKCPHSFYLDLQAGVLRHNNEEEDDAESGTIYTILGADLHNLFDKAANDRSYAHTRMLEDFHPIWYNYSPELFKDEAHKDAMYMRAMESMNNFYEIHKDLPHVAHATEQTIYVPLGDGLPDFCITMDRVDLVERELEVIDWKTGKVMVGKKFTTDLQAPLYIYAIREHFKLPVRKFTFHYVGENKVRTFERITDDEYEVTVLKKTYRISITEAIREVKSLFSRMKNGDFNIPHDVKGMFFTCKMCHHKANGSCQGADEQSWHTKSWR